MQKTLGDPRVTRMLSGDRMWSLAALLLLWLLYAFVFWEVMPYSELPEVFWLLAVGAGLVLLFNTASIVAMLVHLSEDRAEIYGLDLHYLDATQKPRS